MSEVTASFSATFAEPGTEAWERFPSGHTTGPCWTLPFGVTCRLATRPAPTLIVEDPPVE